MNRVSWSWRHAFAKSELASTTKLVLHTIGLHMDETGRGAYPTTVQISELSSLSEKAVVTHIRIAIEQGWLRSKVHGFKGQKWKNHEYEAHWPDEHGDGKGTERHSISDAKALNVIPEGTERQVKKALNEVQSKVPIQHSNNVTPLVPQGGSKAKGHRLPDGWVPSQEGVNLALSLNVDPETELQNFRDYWLALPGAKANKLDWNRTWNNWVRRSKPSRQKAPMGSSMQSALLNAAQNWQA